MPAPSFNQGEWKAVGNGVYSTIPQDVDHAHFKGFEHPEGDAGFLVAESIPHKPTRDLIAAAPKLFDACERAELWLGTVPNSQKIQAILRAAMLEAMGVTDGADCPGN